MKITLEIKDSMFKTFLAFIKTLDYVSVSTEESTIPEWQKEEVKRRIELVEKGQMKTRSWDKAKKEVFKK